MTEPDRAPRRNGPPWADDIVHFAMALNRKILVLEADPGFRETVVRLLALDGFEARGTASPDEALACLDTEPFGLLLCAPGAHSRDEVDLLPRLRSAWPTTAVVLLASPEDEAEAMGSVPALADDVLVRSRCRDDLRLTVGRALEKSRLREENLALRQSLERETQHHLREISRSVRHIERAYRLALESLVAALDAREGETQRHSRRVAEYTARLADRMNVTEREKRDMFHGALLHDLGKIGIPDAILLKPAPLTAEEWRIMRSHPRLGFSIVRDLPFLRAASECVIGHHERWDGLGYPRGIRGEELPRAARIVAVADALDAMSVRRPYRDPLPFDHIVEEFVNNRETQFDPEAVDACLSLFRCWDDLHADAQACRELAERPGSRAVYVEPNRNSRQAA